MAKNIETKFCKSKRAPAALTCLVVLSFAASEVGADHNPPPPPVSAEFDVTFSTAGQSMWGPGTTADPAGGAVEVFNLSWNESGTLANFTEFDIPNVCTSFVSDACSDACKAAKDACFVGCEACGPVNPFCGRKKCRNKCRKVRDECLEGCGFANVCLSSFVDLDLGQYGARASAATSGEFGMEFDTSTVTGGTVDVDYPVRLTLAHPAPDSFRGGDVIRIDSEAILGNGHHITTHPVDGSMGLDGLGRVSGSLSVDVCAGDCFTTTIPSFNLSDNGEPHRVPIVPIDTRTNICLSEWPPLCVPGVGDGCICDTNDPEFVGFSILTGVSGFSSLPDVEVMSEAVGNRLVATGEDLFTAIGLDMDKWLLRALDAPFALQLELSVPTAALGIFVRYNVVDVESVFSLFQNQAFSFEPTIQVTLLFSQPVNYTVLETGVSGNGTAVTFDAGQSVEVVSPNAVVSATPTFAVKDEANFSNDTETRFEYDIDVRALQLQVIWPSFTIVERNEFCIPDTSICAPSSNINFPGVNLGPLGPVFQETTNLAELTDRSMFDGNRAPWSLGGFAPQDGIPILLDPQFQPVAAIAAVASAVEGALATFDAGASTDADNDPLTYTWDFGDGTPSASGVQVSHRFADNGSYPVTVTVDDGHGLPVTATHTITINNAAPTVIAGAIAPAIEGAFVMLAPSSFSDPGFDSVVSSTNENFTATIDWGDGTVEPIADITLAVTPGAPGTLSAGMVQAAHAYGDDGTYVVTVCVRDDDGGEGCDTASVVVSNAKPAVVAGLNQTTTEGAFVTLGSTSYNDPGFDNALALTREDFTATVDWGDGTVEPVLDVTVNETPGSEGTATTGSVQAAHAYGDNGTYTVTVCVQDDDAGEHCDTFAVVVANAIPTVTAGIDQLTTEGAVITLAPSTFSDPGFDNTAVPTAEDFTATVDWGDGTVEAAGSIVLTESPGAEGADTTGTVQASHAYGDNGDYVVMICVSDDDLGQHCDTLNVTVVNAAPSITAVAPSAQPVQYSDAIEAIAIAAHDVAADTLSASTTFTVNGGVPIAGLPAGLALNTDPDPIACTANGLFHACDWTITGEARVPQGSYNIEVTVTDKDGAGVMQSVTLNVNAEDAAVSFDEANPLAVQVETEGGASPLFKLIVNVTELLPDGVLGNSSAAAGDIGEAVLELSLVPVGPGGSQTVICAPVGDPAAFDYNGELMVECAFNGVQVNTYSIEASLVAGPGGLFYTGFADDVITIFDPSLGFTTGGGHFIWQGENGERTNFGFSVNYGQNGKPKGSLLAIRHLTDDTIYRIKSNALDGLAIGEGQGFGWASFFGKCTYQDPTMVEPLGNYTFVAYVEDHGTPGSGVDRFWLQVYDRDGMVIDEFSMTPDAEDEAITISGGNIVVPHTTDD